MRVGFDASFLPADPGAARTGLGRVVENALAALERRGCLEVVRLAPPADADARRWRHRELPGEVRRLGLVGLHSFTSGFPMRGPGRRVQTVHELPWRHGVRENAGVRHRLWAALGPVRADRVVCPSETVAADLRRRLLPGRAKVRVVPWGVGPPFAAEPPPGAVDEVVLGTYRLPEDPFLVAPGATRPKKDLAAVLTGLAAWVRRGGRPLYLVVTGADSPSLRRDLGLASRLGLARWVLTPGVLPDDDLAALLRLSAGVCVLSRSEGFALPVLEALACGRRPIVARGGAAEEVGGGEALAVDPRDPEAVADAFERALAEEDPPLSLAARAAELSWDATAERLEAVWRELAS